MDDGDRRRRARRLTDPEAASVPGDRRCIPPRGVARRSNTSGIFPPRALRGGRLDGLGATRGSPLAAESTALLGIWHYRLRTCGAPQLRRCSDVIALPRRSRGLIASPDCHHGFEGHVSGRSCGTVPVPRRQLTKSVNRLQLVIHLTQVTPTCSVRPRVGFPQESGRVRRPIRVGGGVLGLPGSAALARRIPLSDLRPPEGVASAPPAVRVCRLWPPDVRHGWDDLPGHPQPAHRLVSGDVGRHQSEDRDERADAAAGAGLGQLPNGLDLAAQAATGDGAAKPGPARRLRRSGRDVRRGRRGWRQWPRGQEKGPDCRRCRGRRPAAGPDSAAPGAGRIGE